MWRRLLAVIEREMTGRQGAVVVLNGAGELVAHHKMPAGAERPVLPGSTVKPFTLTTLLDLGRVNCRTTLACGRNLRLAGRRLDCIHPAGDLPLDPVQALAFSCNWYFTRMAADLPPDELASSFERAGLSAAGGAVRRAGNAEQVQLQALGESSIEVTPVGLALAYSRLASRLARQPDTLSPVRDGLLGCTDYGTGQLARRTPFEVAGKTGTASSRGGAWTHGWFAGFAPVRSPEIVVVVFLEQGQGGADAAPIAGTVFEAFRALKKEA